MLNSTGKPPPRPALKPRCEKSCITIRAPGKALVACRVTAMSSFCESRLPVFGSTGRSAGSFMVTKRKPLLTSPPPKPPTKPPNMSTSGRDCRKRSIWLRMRSLASRFDPTGVWKRIPKRLMSCEGMNSWRSRPTMPRERTNRSADPASTSLRWRSAGTSRRW